MLPGWRLRQQFPDFTRRWRPHWTHQQTRLAQVKNIERPAFLQPLAFAPFERENRLPLPGQGHSSRLHGVIFYYLARLVKPG